jgi:hypothetical protein
MDFDWRKRASMLVKCAACMGFGVRGKGASKSSVVEGEDGRERESRFENVSKMYYMIYMR